MQSTVQYGLRDGHYSPWTEMYRRLAVFRALSRVLFLQEHRQVLVTHAPWTLLSSYTGDCSHNISPIVS
jgi:hypothetical protein